ncbi:molybdenum cofactor biosynthesis protein MoaE [Desulfofustis glycolicus]|uniref:Molybdopterin synthase catalytic subunit n=1 Tax=Desulfofustis glycolicus DSM 9705 TaxID=1121409 RepID=A0A1M5V925_9BACT|nr:molybdenum cofactor biosynthesis protein MoaE [Desulfofustis glycolicus]MCB2214888.1 molybdenum cofactor biosynthesis protein MoaE [Desulfobulbaceae bacterium]SHH71772.1 Molybdopterin synthase catalytic subunit [Desulfofustis glycolicus DSM 9705]
MDINATIAALKARPDFADHVGMILVHNGTVRSWSRSDKKAVAALEVTVDHERVDHLRREFLQHQGIYDIIIEAREGLRRPGDDLLFIVVAGDIREHVKDVLARLLDRIKAEAVSKRELTALP